MNAVTDLDLGPLTWVKGEISFALEHATEALSQFRSQGDAAQLKLCRTHLHQVHGALAMVGLAGVAQVTAALEALPVYLEKQPSADPAALDAIQNAMTALQQYLDGLLVGEPNQPLRLFLPYQALMRAQGKAVHPADLFYPDLTTPPPSRKIPPLSKEERKARIHSERNRFQRGMLAWLRQLPGSEAQKTGLLQMQEAIRNIEAMQTSPSVRGFWRSALGLATALVKNANPKSDARHICVRIDLQIRRLLEGNPGVAERLLRDALYFIAQSSGKADPLLAELQAAYRLKELLPSAAQVRAVTNASQESALRRLKESVSGAEEQWNRFCSGSVSSLSAFVEKTHSMLQLAEQLGNGDLKLLAKSLNAVAAWLAKQPHQQSDSMAMEIATALILAQNARENFNRLGQDFPQQVRLMVSRLSECAKGQPLSSEAVPLLDEISRRAQDRLLMAQVVREILHNLTQIEQSLDAYFRDPANTQLDSKALEENLHQVSGALTMLGHDGAVAYLDQCMALIKTFGQSEIPKPEAFETVAQQLSIVGFFVEALQNGPVDFQSFLHQMLHPHADTPSTDKAASETPEDSVEQQLEQLKAKTQHLLEAIKANPGDAQLRQDLETHLKSLQKDADLVADQALMAQVKQALAALKEGDAAHTQIAHVAKVLTPIDIPPEVQTPSEKTLHLAQSSDDEVDAELLEIFLEEAQEVVDSIAENLATLRQQPFDLDTLTTIRRNSHTLKGSGRMVGLKELGEVAWAVEQTLNLWLNQKQEATPELLNMISEAHRVFREWIEHLNAHDGLMPEHASLVALAEELRGGTEVRLSVPAAAGPAPEAPPVLEAPLLEEPNLGEPGAEISVDVSRAPADSKLDATEVSANETSTLDTGEAGSNDLPLTPEETATAPAEEVLAPAIVLENIETADQEVATAAEPSEEAAPLPAEVPFPDLAQEVEEARVELALLPEETPIPDETALLLEEAPQTETGDAEDVEFTLPPESTPPPEESASESQENVVWDANDFAFGASDSTNAAQESASEPEAEAVSDAADSVLSNLSPQLFQIFRKEAQAYMDQLNAFMANMLRTPEMETPFESHRAAHTLAGISGTLGFTPIHDLSRALELALLRRSETQHPESLEGQEILRQAVEQLSGMLSSLDAGRMPGAEQALIHALEELYPPMSGQEEEEVSQEAEGSLLQRLEAWEQEEEEILQEAEGDALTTTEATAPPAQPPSAAVEGDVPTTTKTSTAPASIRIPPASTEEMPQDTLDTDLLPIFLEESTDLLHGLYSQIATWRNDPASEEVAHGLARILHTFKGGARMTGAMRLGQFMHEVESRVGELTGVTAQPADLDEIEAACDIMARVVESYQNGEYDTDLATLMVAPAEAQAEAPPAPPPAAMKEEQAATPVVEEAPPPLIPFEFEEETPKPSVPASAVVDTPARPGMAAEPKAAPAAAASEPHPEAEAKAQLRVRADLVDRLVNEAGEMAINRARIEGEMRDLKESLLTLTDNVIRLRNQLREIEIQAETQIQAGEDESKAKFDPLELDRFTRFQELTRMMAESVNDVSTVQQNLLKNLDDANASIVAQARLNRNLQQSLMGVRMVPFDSQSERLNRLVRQISRELKKRAHLEVVGGQVELDRFVLDKIFSPLEHMVRNSIAHGLESESERAALGKPPVGLIKLTLSQEGNEIILALSDDGAGLNLQRIREKAEKVGLIEPDATLDDRQLTDFIFHSGFSTAQQVSQVAGRGVGMDVVKTSVTALGGRIEVLTESGKGTTFRIYLPLTLAVTQTVLIRAAGREHAIPSNMIEQVMEIREKALNEIYSRGEAIWQNHRYPFHYLPRLLGDTTVQMEQRPLYWVLLLRSGTQRISILVDDLIGNQEVVVKNIGPQMARVIGIAGATVLGDGQIALILNPVALATRAPVVVMPQEQGKVPTQLEAVVPVQRQPIIMVVDDSLTVRKITQKLLTREGYQVELAKDGIDAMEHLVDMTPDVILSDIEMPRMDGFDLVRHVRADERLSKIPIIMITSRTAEKHRAYAKEIGANHYLGKPYSETELLNLLAGYTARPQ